MAPCDARPAMPAARRGPGGLSALPGAEVVAAAGGLMTAIWPAYEGYQRKTTRDIPVVILERS